VAPGRPFFVGQDGNASSLQIKYLCTHMTGYWKAYSQRDPFGKGVGPGRRDRYCLGQAFIAFNTCHDSARW
jgi:hypothetical protein